MLVIDNLDDMNVIAGRLPSCSPTKHTLITTRYSHCDHIPAQGLEVGVMEPNDAIDLLLLRSKGGSSTEKETAECAKIVEELGYLPLAIEQAAAFIREGSKDLYMFLPSYWENRQFYHSRVSRGNLRYYSRSIATTGRTCLQTLEETNTDALKLVKLMSFLNPDGILVDFLDTGKDALSADFRAIISNKIRFYEAVAALERFSLIGRQGSGSDRERLTIHRLVQSIIKDEMPQELLSTMAECVLRLCDIAFPPWHNWDHALLSQSRRYVGQVLMPLVTIHQLQSNDFVNLLLRAGVFLRGEGKYQESSKLVLKAVEVLNLTRGPDHPETINALAILALTYQSQGRWNDAVELQGRALKMRMRLLGEEHPETLRVMKNLAVSLHGQRRAKEAVELLERVLEVNTRLLGEEHPDTVMAMANLAATYCSQGRWDEAGKLQETVLEVSSRLLGNEHPDTLMAMINLASTYRSQGRWDEAMNLQQKGLEVRTRVLGTEHPETATAMANLPLTYWSQRRWDEAENLQETVLELRIRLLGTEHPDTVMAMAILALTYGLQGKLEDALKLQKGLDVSTMLSGTALSDLNATDNDGRTLLHYAAGGGAGLELVKWLIDNMADVKAIDRDGRPVLHYAPESGSLEVVKWLAAEKREIISMKDSSGETALDVSKCRQRDEIFEFLSHMH